MELSYLYVHERYWLCKIVEAAPLDPFIYTVVSWDKYGAFILKYAEDVDPDTDREWLNDEL